MANLLVAVILGIVLYFSPTTNSGPWPGLSFLLVLQISAVIFNLIPLPPFDGYNFLEPFLPSALRTQVDQFRGITIWIVFMLFWFVPPVANAFWDSVYQVSTFLGVDWHLVVLGFERFRFWNL